MDRAVTPAASRRRLRQDHSPPGQDAACRPARTDRQLPAPGQIREELLVYRLPDDFALPSFRGACLVQIAIGQHQIQLNFDGKNRGVCIESRYAIEDPAHGREEFTTMPGGAAQLAALLGAHLDEVSGTCDGTLKLSFATGITLIIFDDSSHYESYQIHDGDRLIVV